MSIDPGILAGLMGGAGAGGPAGPPADGPAGPSGPPPMMPDNAGPGGPPQDGPVTMYTSAAIQALHDAIAHEQDADDKAVLAECLRKVLQVQAKNSKQAGGGAPGGPGAAVQSAVGGGY